MINEALLRRYLKQLLLILLIIITLLAFIWINFLYTRFQRETQKFMRRQEEVMQEFVSERAASVLRVGDRSYDQEYEELRLETQALLNGVRTSIYELYSSSASEEEFREKVEEIDSRMSQESGYSFYLVNRDTSLAYGTPPPNLPPQEETGFAQDGDVLYYVQRLYFPPSTIYLYTDSNRKVKENMEKSLSAFLEMDRSILVFDEAGKNLMEDAEFAGLAQLQAADHQFFEVHRSEISGYTFGYTLDREELEAALAARNAIFSSFLRNHVWELVAFFVILVLTTALVFRQFFKTLRVNQSSMKALLLQSYENQTDLSQEPLFRHFSLTPALNEIFEDMRGKQKKSEEYTRGLEMELKRQQVSLLSLERKVQSLSSGNFFTDGVITSHEIEEFSLLDLIRSVHQQSDSEAPLVLTGDPFLLESDPAILGNILRDFFSLTRSEARSYKIVVNRQEQQLQLHLTLKNPGTVDERFFDHLKRMARRLEGTLLKNSPAEDGLYLSLLFPLERG